MCMTEVLLTCGSYGQILSFLAEGHAAFARKGHDIVCAAESILVRTAIETLQATKDLNVITDASSRGRLAFRVEVTGQSPEMDLAVRERLVCVADFLRNGFRSLCQEYPKCVKMREVLNH